MELKKFIDRARSGGFRLWLLNRLLYRVIPFNKPHQFRISNIGDDEVTVTLPYRRKNLNHIKGLHACAMATLAEYTTGFMMIRKLNAKEYRIIMQRIEMNYHYQGKTDAFCTFRIDDRRLTEEITDPLKKDDSVVFVCEPEIYDVKENHLATGKVYWQVKRWDKVRTKI